MTPAARASVVAEARSWLFPPTPYHHHGRVKGAGVDCAQLLCAVYEAAGLVPHVETGHYPVDWHLHHSEERFIGWLKEYAVPLAPGEVPRAGDVALFRYGRAFSHGAVMIDEITCIHSYIGRGVIQNRLNEEPLAGRAVLFWGIKPAHVDPIDPDILRRFMMKNEAVLLGAIRMQRESLEHAK